MQDDDMDPDDARLVALIDERLAPAERATLERRLSEEGSLRARLEHLRQGGVGLAEGFAALGAAAPQARLEAWLGNALAQGEADPPDQTPVGTRNIPEDSQPRPARGWRPAALAAGLALFLAGAAAGHWLPALWPQGGSAPVEEAGADGWRAVVAEYFPLTTNDTLRVFARDPAQIKADLVAAGMQADLALTPERLAVPGLSLARVDLFQLDDRALIEISYLDPQNGPVALCILSRPDAAAPPQSERRGAFNIAWWGNGSAALMLIGRTPTPQLQALAEKLSRQLGA